MDIESLKQQYSTLPREMCAMKRWVGYKTETRDGQSTKVPYNAITGQRAKSNDKYTWTNFDVAIAGVAKYGFDGLGFMLGEGIFGVDLDNHPDPTTGEYAMSEEEFSAFSSEFVKSIDSYAEWSRSRKGIHIICKGSLPNGRRRRGCVEMYDKGRFFACTGYTINNSPVLDRTAEIIPLWKKYLDDSDEVRKAAEIRAASPLGDMLGKGSGLTDSEVLDKACRSKNGSAFSALYNGDMSSYGNDHSMADMALCSQLAFWCNGDAEQIDRIFRSSALMREKWDSMRGSMTYGRQTIGKAVSQMTDGYVKPEERPEVDHRGILFNGGAPKETKKAEEPSDSSDDRLMNIDENRQPIFHVRKLYKSYPYNDTGNAEFFYDQFGDLFHFNKDSKVWMFWTGKTWEEDKLTVVRKYASKIAELRKEECKRLESDVKKALEDDDGERAKRLKSIYESAIKNADRISNKAGKDAMINELESFRDIPVLQNDFDKDIYLLNTDSGIVDLRTGNLSLPNRDAMLSKNTRCAVSFSEPKVWMEFLHGVFWRGDGEAAKRETEEIIEYIQQWLGYTLTGSTREQKMCILYGNGSNGKTTFVEALTNVFGDYGKSKESSILMANPNKGQSVQFSLAELPGTRFLIAEETNEGQRMDEGGVKSLTGSGKISAQKKFGNPFEFYPQFKIWMLTNILPIIQGTDYGIWRRIVPIPFLRKFTEEEKDMDMPIKLKAEAPKILGWCVRGYGKYVANGGRLVMPECLRSAIRQYQMDMDVVEKFLDKCCVRKEGSKESTVEMYSVFKEWGDENKEFILRESKFGDKMSEKGFPMERDERGERWYCGVEIVPSWKYKASSQSAYSGFKSKGFYDDD